MDKDLFAPHCRFDESEATFVIPGFQASFESHVGSHQGPTNSAYPLRRHSGKDQGHMLRQSNGIRSMGSVIHAVTGRSERQGLRTAVAVRLASDTECSLRFADFQMWWAPWAVYPSPNSCSLCAPQFQASHQDAVSADIGSSALGLCDRMYASALNSPCAADSLRSAPGSSRWPNRQSSCATSQMRPWSGHMFGDHSSSPNPSGMRGMHFSMRACRVSLFSAADQRNKRALL